MQRNTIYAIILFLGLTAATAVMMIAAKGLADAYERAVLMQMGCALFGAGLTVLLVRLLGAVDANKKGA